MKNTKTPSRQQKEAARNLASALASINDAKTMMALLQDLCTPSELEALSDRWRVVPGILQGQSYRSLHAETGVSVTTIGRVARCLHNPQSAYRTLFLKQAHKEDHHG